MRVYLIASWLLAAARCRPRQDDLQSQPHRGGWQNTYEKTRDDAEALLKHAVDNGMGTSVQLCCAAPSTR